MSDIALKLATKGFSARRAGARARGMLGGTALLCGVVVVALAAAMAALARAPERVVEPKPAALVESWAAIARPVQVYSFEAPAFRGLPAAYAARRHTLGRGREDRLAFGAFGLHAPMLRLSLFRRAGEAPDAMPLASALARAAADAGLSVVGNGVPGGNVGGGNIDRDAAPEERIATRFGRVEVADLALSDLALSHLVLPAGTKATSCSGFRLALDRPAFSMTGLVCAADGRPMPRRALGCLIERLDLASARDDRDLIDFFAASELRRDAGCAGMGLGPDAAHAAWLDDISDTPKRSSRRR